MNLCDVRNLTNTTPTDGRSGLFCMEDSGRYTTEELAKAAEEWHERALKFGNYYIGNQGQSSLSFTYMYRYTRAVEAVTNGTEN